MKQILLAVVLLMASTASAQVIDGLAVCCGATTDRPDLPGRTEGFGHNLPPMDSIRFGQLYRERDFQMWQAPPNTYHAPEAAYPPSFSLYNFEDGGYNPQVGTYHVKPPKPVEWLFEGIEWASERRAKRGQRP